jgi:hypothetical protein
MTDPATPGTLRIETANSIWVFETERHRFWRVPRGLDVNSPSTARAWQPYFKLEIDAQTGAFSVWLDAEGTRLLRSYRLDPEDHADATSELQLEPRD